MVLPLMSCELVLGVKWLRELGLIVWNFKTLTMQFSFQNQQYILHGLKDGAIQLASKRQAAKCCNSVRGTCTLLMTTVSTTKDRGRHEKGHKMPWNLQYL